MRMHVLMLFLKYTFFFDVIYDLKGNLKPLIILTDYAEGLKVLFILITEGISPIFNVVDLSCITG